MPSWFTKISSKDSFDKLNEFEKIKYVVDKVRNSSFYEIDINEITDLMQRSNVSPDKFEMAIRKDKVIREKWSPEVLDTFLILNIGTWAKNKLEKEEPTSWVKSLYDRIDNVFMIPKENMMKWEDYRGLIVPEYARSWFIDKIDSGNYPKIWKDRLIEVLMQSDPNSHHLYNWADGWYENELMDNENPDLIEYIAKVIEETGDCPSWSLKYINIKDEAGTVPEEIKEAVDRRIARTKKFGDLAHWSLINIAEQRFYTGEAPEFYKHIADEIMEEYTRYNKGRDVPNSTTKIYWYKYRWESMILPRLINVMKMYKNK